MKTLKDFLTEAVDQKLLKVSQELGTKARDKNIKAAAQDAEFMKDVLAKISGEVGSSIPYLDAWNKAWQKRHHELTNVNLKESYTKEDHQRGCKTIISQIATSTRMSIGYHNPSFDSSNKNINLTFKVKARTRQAWVKIELNSKDLYDVYLLKGSSGSIASTQKDIYAEDLSDVIENMYDTLN